MISESQGMPARRISSRKSITLTTLRFGERDVERSHAIHHPQARLLGRNVLEVIREAPGDLLERVRSPAITAATARLDELDLGEELALVLGPHHALQLSRLVEDFVLDL